MSNTAVENEIVRMQFDNRQFEAGVKQSMSTLDKLKAALHLDKSAQGFKQIGDAAKKVNFNPITNGIEGVKRSFSAMDVAFATAVARMTNDAITAGKKIATALTIDPIKTGLSEYETKLNAVQVMKSNKGGSIEEITQALDELNRYADKTIYNFTQMTNNVGKFVAQGMSAKEAAKAVEGMANLAGASGASAEDMARATYQMSQAMGGTIRKIDWNSLRNANMATMQLKDVLKAVAKTEYGTDVDALMKKKGASFEDTLEEGWLSGDLFKRAMEMYSDVYSEAELKGKGYTEAQIKMFKDLAKEAAEATTSVKTLSQLWDVVKETAQSGWTQSWEWIIGDLDEAKRIWTNLNNMISGYIDKVSTARNKLLEIWATGYDSDNAKMDEEGNPIQDVLSSANLTGRQEVLLGLSEFMHSITEIANSIRAAFVDIFPPMTAKRAVELSHSFRKLMQAIKPTYKELSNIFYAVRGVLSVIGLFRDILAEVIKALFPVFSKARDLNEIILQAAGFIGQLLYATTKWLRESGTIHTVVAGISKVVGELLKQIGRIIVQIFRIVHDTGLDRFLVKLIGWIGNGLVYAIEHVVTLVTKIGDILEKVAPKIKLFFGGLVEAVKSGKLIDYLVDKFKSLGKAIAELGKGDGTNTLFTKLGKFYSTAIDIISNAVVATYRWAKSLDLTQGIAIALSVIFGTLLFRLSSLVKAMTLFTKNWSAVGTSISKFFNRIKMHNPIVLELAIFIGVLAGSLKLISTIDTKTIWNGVGAIAALSAVMYLFGKKISGITKDMKMVSREQLLGMLSMFLTMSIVMLTLTKSVSALSKLNWNGLAKGLAGIGVIMLELVGIAFIVSKLAPKLTLSGAVMLLFASSLSFAIKKFLNINWQAINSLSKSMLWTATWLGVAALALGIGTEKLALSIARIALGLALIAGAFYLINKLDFSLGSLGILALSVLGMIFIIDVLGDASSTLVKNEKSIKEFSKGIMRVTFAIGMIVVVMKLAESLKNMGDSVGVLVITIIAIGSLIAWMGYVGTKAKKSEKVIGQLGRSMLLISIAMTSIMIACTAIGAIALLPGGEKILLAAGGILLALTVSIGILIKMSSLGSKVKMGPIIALMLGIAAVFTNLVIIAGLGPDKIYAATISVGSVLGALSLVILMLALMKPDNVMVNIVTLLSISVLLISFAISMKTLCEYKWEDIGARLLEIVAAFVAFETVIVVAGLIAEKAKILTGDMIVAATTIAIMSTSMLILATTMNALPYDWKLYGEFAAVLGAMMVAFAALGLVGYTFSKGITKLATALLEMGAALGTFALTALISVTAFAAFIACLYALSKIDLSGTIGVLLAFAVAIVALVAATGFIKPALAVLLAFGVALLAISGALLLGSVAILNLTKALKEMSKLSAGHLAKVAISLGLLSSALILIGTTGIVALLGISSLDAISDALTKMSQIDIHAIAEGLLAFSVAVNALVPGFLTLIGSALGLKIFSEELSKLEPSLLACATSIDILVADMQKFIAIKDQFVRAANFVGEGLKKGLSSGLKESRKVMSNCANDLIGIYSSELGIASPSKVFKQLGYYTMMGLIVGINENSDKAVNAIKSVTNEIATTVSTNMQSIKEAGKNAGDTLVDAMLDTFDTKKTKAKEKGEETGKTAGAGVKSAFINYAENILAAAQTIGHNAGVSFANAMTQQVAAGVSQIEAMIAGIKAEYKDFKLNGKFDEYSGGLVERMRAKATNALMPVLENAAKQKDMTVEAYLDTDEYKEFIAENQIRNKMEDKYVNGILDSYDKSLAILKYESETGKKGLSFMAAANKLSKEDNDNINKIIEELQSQRITKATDDYKKKAESKNMDLTSYVSSGQFAKDLKREEWENADPLTKIGKVIKNGFAQKVNSMAGQTVMKIEDLTGEGMGNGLYDYLGFGDLKSNIDGDLYDYSSKVQTTKRVTEKEFEAIKNTADLKVLTMSEEGRLNHLKFGDVNFTEEAMREKGYEYNAKDKTWYKYFTVKNKDGKEEIEVIQKETDAMNGLTDSTDKLGKTAKETETEMEAFTKALNSNLKSAMNYFDEFKYGTEEDKISKKDLLKNLEEQHNGMISWAKDMEELAHRGMAKDLWKNLAEEGPASYAKVKAFLDMTASELQSANDWFARDLALPDVTTDYMSNILQQYFGESGELHDKMYENGKWFSKGLANGMAGDESKGEIADAASIVVKTANDTVESDGGINSPSKVWAQYGVYFVEGLMVGMRDTMRACTKQISNMIKTINRTVRDGLRADIFKTIGRNAMQGLISGFVSQMDQLNRIVNNIADRIPHTITGKWVIKSPSRLFKSFGMYAMEGLALGLSQYSTLAEAAAAETADNTAKTLNGITNSVLDWDTDFNPVITPTLNLDNVTRGVREINDMFKETTLDTVVEEPDQNGGATTQPSTTFIQNNYSPKHLSSIDIYRQTRNQLSSLKGAMG